MSSKDDGTFFEEHLGRFIAGDIQATQNLHQMKTSFFLCTYIQYPFLGQILVSHFSITTLKGDNSKAKVLRNTEHFFKKFVHWNSKSLLSYKI